MIKAPYLLSLAIWAMIEIQKQLTNDPTVRYTTRRKHLYSASREHPFCQLLAGELSNLGVSWKETNWHVNIFLWLHANIFVEPGDVIFNSARLPTKFVNVFLCGFGIGINP